MRKYLGMGKCQKCSAKEVIAHSGNFHRCSRCFPRMWEDIGDWQKANFMEFGSVHGEKKFAKSAK